MSTTAVKTNLLCNYNHVNIPTLETGIEWQHSLEHKLENARHCGASLTEDTWSSYMHLTVIRTWLNLRPGYNIQACCTQAQAAGRGDGMDR